MSASLYDIPVRRIDGQPANLGAYRGKVLLIVNVASKCGLTPQYAGLEQLYEAKQAEGLTVLAFPANDFRGQEPGSNEEIAAFCSTQYGVQFPVFEKISVIGENQHPLYRQLTAAQPQATGDGPFRERLRGFGMQPANDGSVLWNFEKFVVGRDGSVVERFAPDVAADDPRLLATLDAELAKQA